MTHINPSVLLLLLTFSTSHASQLERQVEALPLVPAPPQAYVEWIAPQMRMNGLPMSIRSFRCPAQPDAALRHFEQWWSTSKRGKETLSRRSWVGEWQVLALTSDTHHISVQVRAQGTGSEGTITTSPNPASVTFSTTTKFPLPGSMRVQNLQQYEDAGALAEHITLTSRRSLNFEAHTFAQLLVRNGWTIVQNSDAHAVPRAHVIQAQRGAELAHITLQPAATHTSAVVIWRKPE